MNLKHSNVLVTGAGGFIGSHLAEHLSKTTRKTRALVHYNALGSHGWLDHSDARADIEIVAGDITDRDSVKAAMQGVDVVFHLAALIAIPYSYHAPYSYVRTNIDGTLNVLQAARELDTTRVVHTSTSEVYGTAQEVPISETHPLQGQSPYSATKIGADKLAESFFRSFDLPVTTVRPFNTFGPRQSARAVIPTIITQCLTGSDVIHLGSLHPLRDLNYVANTVEGFCAAAACDEALGQTFNLGSGREISIGDLAAEIIRLTGSQAGIETDDQRIRPEKSEVNRLLADYQKATGMFGWQPRVSLEEGLAETVRWIRDHLDFYRPEQYNV